MKTKNNEQNQKTIKKVFSIIKDIAIMTEIKISNNVLAIVAAILLLVNAGTFILSSRNMISGRASSTGAHVSLCIVENYSLTGLQPQFSTVVAGEYNTSAIGTNVQSVDFYYFKYGNPRTLFATDHDANNDTEFNATFDSTSVPDGNCDYAFIAQGNGACGRKTISSAAFSIDNVPVEPTWTEFQNNLSTNFSLYTNWSEISYPIIAVPGYGSIRFRETTNFDEANLDAQFNISQNRIDINTTGWCFRDVEYAITFFNASGIVDPIVLKDDQPCKDECYNYNITNDSFEFTSQVIQDATFSLVEGANITLNLTLNFDGESVDINWTYILNNNYSGPPDYYNLYYSDNASEMVNFQDFGSPNVSHITTLNWTDYTANTTGERYYVVTAVKGSREVRATATGCKYDVPVYDGQNLISLPCNTKPISIDDNLRPPGTSYYDRVTRYVPGTGFQRTDYYGTIWKWWGAFEYVESKSGYYMFPTKADYTIVDVGVIPIKNQTINISAGTNLVGWVSVFDKNISSVLSPGDNSWYDSIQQYNDTTSWIRTDYYGPIWKWWGWFEQFNPGVGYWFYPTNESYTWKFDPLP